MEELRSEIRDAFEREQAPHPAVAALRRNVVDAVTAQPRRETNLQWLAVAAAVILGILVVAGLMSTRFAPRASVPANPTGPLKDYGPPPAGLSLLYVVDPRNYSWLQAYDWQGQPRGTVKLPQALDKNFPGIEMAPDGSGFIDFPPGTSSRGSMGKVRWADDNRHRCFVMFDGEDWTLSTYLPGQTAQLVAIVGRDPHNVVKRLSLAACSFRNDLAILVQDTDIFLSGGEPAGMRSDLWILRLSDGSTVSHHAYAYDTVSWMVASSDAEYLAQSTSGPGPIVTVRRVSDWTVIKTLPAVTYVWQFSGDDSLILCELMVGNGAMTSVFDWRSGKILWTDDRSQDDFYSWIAEPGGRDFAVAHLKQPESVPDSTPVYPLRDVVIIHGDGTTTAIPGRYVTLW
jgi:hypothetical protein